MRTAALIFGQLLWSAALLQAAPEESGPGKQDLFNEKVRPTLASHCFKCHGPDEKARKAKLRLDVREAAIALDRDGKQAIVPGQPGQSELVRRIFAAEDEGRMPP